MRGIYIFDLDGTIADISHRRHIIEDKDRPNRWREFYAACDNDLPNTAVIYTMHQLVHFADIWIWSGRSDEVRDKTVAWLTEHTALTSATIERFLRMRKAGDHTPDDKLKKGWLDSLSATDRKRIIACFDDRDRIVKMYRENGIACFQVADGDF